MQRDRLVLYEMKAIFPEAWETFSGFLPEEDQDDLLEGYYRRLIDPTRRCTCRRRGPGACMRAPAPPCCPTRTRWRRPARTRMPWGWRGSRRIFPQQPVHPEERLLAESTGCAISRRPSCMAATTSSARSPAPMTASRLAGGAPWWSRCRPLGHGAGHPLRPDRHHAALPHHRGVARWRQSSCGSRWGRRCRRGPAGEGRAG